MTFGAPSILLLLIFPVIAHIALAWEYRCRLKGMASWISPRHWGRLFPNWDPEARSCKLLLWSLAIAFATLALARPQWGTREETVHSAGLDVLLVLDVSRSMEVEDVVPSRMKKARHWIRTLLERIQGDRAGVVAFAASSYVASPLTTDLDYVLETVEVLGPDSVVNQGTDIGLGLETALAALERGAQAQESPDARSSAPSRAVVLISDGEDQEAAAEAAAAKLAAQGVRLYVIGVGTEKGGPIPLRDSGGTLSGFKRAGSEVVMSRFDPAALQKLASRGSGKYWNASMSEGEVDEIVRDLGALNRAEFAERKVSFKIERYQWPLAVALLLLLIELWIPLKKRGAQPARVAVVLLVGLFLVPSRANALPFESYSKNRQGMKLFSQEKVEDAEQKFAEAQAMEPHLAEPQFNLGVAKLKKGDTKSAVQSFESASRQAGLAGNAELTARSLYNLGASFEADQHSGDAVRSFARSVRMAELSGDATLATDARKRIEKLQQKMEQEQKQAQQNQKNSKDGKGQGKGEGDGQGNAQDRKDPQDPKDGQKPESKQYEDPSVSRRRPFKSDTMSPEDSERVMSELSAREKELQSRLKKQRGARQAAHGKDW